MTKLIVVMLLVAVVATLIGSVYFLVKDESREKRTLRMLKIRVALSLTLIAFVILSYSMGWIQPHAGPLG